MTIAKSIGAMESIFGNRATTRIIDFLAVQNNSQTISDIAKGTGLQTLEVENAIRVLFNNNMIGIDRSKSTGRGEFPYSSQDTYYHIRTDNPGGTALIHLYNYFNCLRGQKIVLYSSDVSISDY